MNYIKFIDCELYNNTTSMIKLNNNIYKNFRNKYCYAKCTSSLKTEQEVADFCLDHNVDLVYNSFHTIEDGAVIFNIEGELEHIKSIIA